MTSTHVGRGSALRTAALGANVATRAWHTVRLPVAVLALVASCSGDAAQQAAVGEATATFTPADGVPVIAEAYTTARDTLDNIDSPAVWHAPDGETWMLATAKETDVVVVYDASDGREIRRVGGTGTAAGQLDRPNGIAVLDELMFIVERDNARVQVFTLPELMPIGTYGEPELRRPYGIAIVRDAPGVYTTYITDNYELEEDVVPPDSMLGERVRQYRVTVAPHSGLTAQLVRAFGDTSGDGVLRVVESIAADPAQQRLLIAEEQEGASMIKAYTLDGRFTGEIIESRFFPHQAEGIALYECADRAGYWIATDQSTDVNTFHVFDRATLAYAGSFRGSAVLNTDGIALTQTPFDGFPEGAFFAVDNDGAVAAFRWQDIAEAAGLRMDCVVPRG